MKSVEDALQETLVEAFYNLGLQTEPEDHSMFLQHLSEAGYEIRPKTPEGYITVSKYEWGDLHHRFSCVLNRVTKGMSRTNYALDAMYSEIDEYLDEWAGQVVEDYKEQQKGDGYVTVPVEPTETIVEAMSEMVGDCACNECNEKRYRVALKAFQEEQESTD